MEASCSGRCACNAPCYPTGARRGSMRHAIRHAPQLTIDHRSFPHQIRSHQASPSSRAKRKHRQCIVAAQNSGEVAEVQELRGVRIVADKQKRPQVQYLVNWKDGTADTWEPAQNLADNLLRDFEERWWTICRKGDKEAMQTLLSKSAKLLATTVDENRRSGLHFTAAVGNAECTRMLCEAGADIDLGDKQGYTPLHMAVGYSRTTTVQVLLDYGADPEVADKEGRNVVELVEKLRDSMPLTPELLGRRTMLENVAGVLTENLYEEVEPVAVLDARVSDAGREFLVKFPDAEEDAWVNSKYVAEDLVEDFDAGLEYAEADCILDVQQKGDSLQYLIRWQDDYPDSWEAEESISPDIIAIWEQKRESAKAQDTSRSGSNDGSTPPTSSMSESQLEPSPV
ncbi:Signal recognition particle 43 kDa protein, chloroplastic [Trebouxia sp. C0009 RCD-2024]